jgi:hypothetical protein
VTLIVSNSIDSDTLTLNNYVTVLPYPPPQSITQNGDTLFANTGAVSYQWYHNGVLIPGATNYFYVASTGGDYYVIATDVNGCEVEAAIFNVVAAVSSLSFADGSGVWLYPNPVEKDLIIKTSNDLDLTAIEFIIFNALGQKVITARPGGNNQRPAESSERQLAIDCKFLPSGIYYLQILTSYHTYQSRFIKR